MSTHSDLYTSSEEIKIPQSNLKIDQSKNR